MTPPPQHTVSLPRRNRASRGDTLVETLVAILICSFAVIILVTGIVAAASLNNTAAARDTNLQQQREHAENASGAAKIGTLVFNGTDYSVPYYGGSDIVGYE